MNRLGDALAELGHKRRSGSNTRKQHSEVCSFPSPQRFSRIGNQDHAVSASVHRSVIRIVVVSCWYEPDSHRLLPRPLVRHPESTNRCSHVDSAVLMATCVTFVTGVSSAALKSRNCCPDVFVSEIGGRRTLPP